MIYVLWTNASQEVHKVQQEQLTGCVQTIRAAIEMGAVHIEVFENERLVSVDEFRRRILKAQAQAEHAP